MVKSGLVDRIDVSQYRLALHLSVAFADPRSAGLAGAGGRSPRRTRRVEHRDAGAAAHGDLRSVRARLRAGRRSARSSPGSRPAYLQHLAADGRRARARRSSFALTPWYLNFFENVTTVQFDHRLVAYAVVGLASVARGGHRAPLADDERIVGVRPVLLAAALLSQMMLGIWTLLSGVPIGARPCASGRRRDRDRGCDAAPSRDWRAAGPHSWRGA